ncbi:MAG: hypothetical protein VYB15_08145 [Planctomycetota bacterium]|nr:hypothetical protein [Planctomycetota bacterium]
MKRLSPALVAFAVLVLFCAATLVSAIPRDKRPRLPKVPRPPTLKKAKGIGNLGKALRKSGKGRKSGKNSGRKNQKKYDKKKKEEEERYHVVQIGLKFEVVQQKKLSSARKSAPKKYKAQVAQYEKARKSAEKKGREFKTPKPPSSVFKVLSNKGYKTQKEAQANAQRLQRKAASKRKQ